MKASEFKKILKPLIEQTVKEVLLHEGVLSKIVAEVASGLRKPLVETKNDNTPPTQDSYEDHEANRQEKIKRLNETVNLRNTNVFDGVKEIPENNSHDALADVSPRDPGVDITAIQALSQGKWKRLAGGKDV